MIEAEINKKNLSKFIKNISPSDYCELKACFKKQIKKKFIKLCLNCKNGSYLLFNNDNHPIAIGGAVEIEYPIKNSAKIWLLTTNEYINDKIALYKYLKTKIDIYKIKYDYIYNYIYKSNYKALKWLTKQGFSVKKIENADFQFFYYVK